MKPEAKHGERLGPERTKPPDRFTCKVAGCSGHERGEPIGQAIGMSCPTCRTEHVFNGERWCIKPPPGLAP